jgi:hypothetical protein
VRGIEIAELCPVFDVDDRTARLGASLIFEIASTLGDGDEEEDTDADADEESEVDDPERQPSDEDRSDADDDGGPIDRF